MAGEKGVFKRYARESLSREHASTSVGSVTGVRERANEVGSPERYKRLPETDALLFGTRSASFWQAVLAEMLRYSLRDAGFVVVVVAC